MGSGVLKLRGFTAEKGVPELRMAFLKTSKEDTWRPGSSYLVSLGVRPRRQGRWLGRLCPSISLEHTLGFRGYFSAAETAVSLAAGDRNAGPFYWKAI